MTTLVQSSSQPRLGINELSFSRCIETDIAFAQRRSWNPFKRKREQRYVVLDINTDLPTELERRDCRDIKLSAIRLPASTESLIKIQRYFENHEKLASGEYRLVELVVRDCDNECAERCDKEGVIFYVITARINRRSR
jgi:hypothetical protein